MEIELAWWHWVAFGLALLVGDLLLVNSYYLVWLGLGAAAVGVLMLPFPGIGLVVQMVLWGVISIAMIVAWIKLRGRFAKLRRPESMIGVRGVVLDWAGGKGSVKFQRPYGGRDIWQASSDHELSRGDSAQVTAVDAEQKTVTLSR